MNYEIEVRKVNPNDLSADCFNNDIDQDEYNMQLNLLVEDISHMQKIDNVSLNGHIISISSDLKENDLLEELKELFGREVCYIYYVGINQVV
jgi:hypothetical protein